METLGIKPND
jgi:pentatricopeptide repeat protein